MENLHVFNLIGDFVSQSGPTNSYKRCFGIYIFFNSCYFQTISARSVGRNGLSLQSCISLITRWIFSSVVSWPYAFSVLCYTWLCLLPVFVFFPFCLLICKNCLHILSTNPLPVTCIANIFSQSVACLFIFFKRSLVSRSSQIQ